MTNVHAIAELRRMFPDATHIEARLSASIPNNPGWRCQVAAWNDSGTIDHYGRGETFEGALADMMRREVAPIRVVRVLTHEHVKAVA